MTPTFSLRTEFLRHTVRVVPPVLGMSVVLGLFNADEWTLAAILPKVQTSLGMGLIGCALGLIALFIGLWTKLSAQNMMYGWLAGLVAGFAGIAFMLWFYANPVTS
jgi:ABC-type amino acid transport system permease subunit